MTAELTDAQERAVLEGIIHIEDAAKRFEKYENDPSVEFEPPRKDPEIETPQDMADRKQKHADRLRELL